MKLRLAFAALVILALVAALLWTMRDDARPRDVSPDAPAEAVASRETKRAEARRRERAAVKPDAPPPAEETRSEEDAPEPSPTSDGPRPVSVLLHRVKVTVTDSSGGRAHDATVRLVSAFAHHTGFASTGELVSGTTDAEGRATLVTRLAAPLLVLAEREGEAAIGERVDVPRERKEDLESHVSLRLAPAFVLAGRVVDESGAGVTGAIVTLRLAWTEDPIGIGLSRRTGDRGAFRFPGVPRDVIRHSNAAVAARAKGYVPASRLVPIDDPRPDGLLLRLGRGITVRGRCVDTDGRQVEAARVSVPGVATDGVLSGEDGSFELWGVPRARTTVAIVPKEFAPQLVEIAADAGDIDLGVLVFKRGGLIRGIVVDVEMRPVGGALVETSFEDLDGYRRDTTDAEGRFELHGLADGAHTVRAARRSGGATVGGEAGRAARVVPNGPEIRVVLSSPRTLLVRFLAESDRSPVVVNDGTIIATPVDGDGEPLEVAFAGSGSSSIRLHMPSAGLYDLSVEIPGYSLGEVEGVEVRDDRGVQVDILFRQRAD